MTFLISRMLDEIDAAEEYCKAARDTDMSMDARRVYKEIALQELSHFDRLANVYQQKMSMKAMPESRESSGDIWFKYFKQKAEKLKTKINEI